MATRGAYAEPQSFFDARSHAQATCIRANGTLWCKGYNPYGQLGNGTLADSVATFVQVGTANDWTSVTAGTYATCGLRGSGDLYCWGSNDYGEAGDGTSFTSSAVVVP